MPLTDPGFWSDRVRQVFERYDDPLLRWVAGKLYRPRGQWPIEHLVERSVTTLSNAAVIDRRLNDLSPACSKLLALMGYSRQPRWSAAGLIELLAALGHAEGVQPILTLFEEGLLFPDLSPDVEHLQDFEHWLGMGATTGLYVFSHPLVIARALRTDLGLPACPAVAEEITGIQEADGLEWPLRLAVVWQQVADGSLRQTQQGGFFKRDLDRLRSDSILNAPFAEITVQLPDMGLLAVELATLEGILQPEDGELRTGALPEVWQQGLLPTLESLWSALPHLNMWNPAAGWQDSRRGPNPYPAAYLLALLLLAQLQDAAWARPQEVADWVRSRHPFWRPSSPMKPARARQEQEDGLVRFLSGLAVQLRLVQMGTAPNGDPAIRLSATGRWLLNLSSPPPLPSGYPRTMLVQPNLEILAYRQGLTPSLIAVLTQIAVWKSLGAACILQIQPNTVYRALESGWKFETILQTLEHHGTRPTPPSVIDSLRTWADKRERLTIYTSAALFEFATPADLDDALGRGLPGAPLTERIAIVPDERAIDFRHFRLMGTRDYSLPPDQCVEVDGDGVTLTIDPVRSDLLLETELGRFAEMLGRLGVNGRRQYRLTTASLAAGRENGLTAQVLEDWFSQRTGQPITPAARLLFTGSQAGAVELKEQLVLHVGSPEVADGLLQWPATRGLIQARLGPTALLVAPEHVNQLRERLGELRLHVLTPSSAP
jgi:hypothetical protein